MVLPESALALPDVARAIIVQHERAHVRAGDNRLFYGGLLLAILLPWCLPVWWLLKRLRVAIELDCDRRVLGAGVRTPDYAELMIFVSARSFRRSLLPATQSSSFLAARIE